MLPDPCQSDAPAAARCRGRVRPLVGGAGRRRPAGAGGGLVALAALAWGCAFEPTVGAPAPVPEGTITQVLVISNYRFSPERLPVVPGSAVLVRNEDHVAHTVTSAAAPGALEFGAVNGVAFDTPPFLGDSTISIPAEAPVGTIVPYFCRMHGAAMLNRGELEIVAPP